jgi:hypothetical protein
MGILGSILGAVVGFFAGGPAGALYGFSIGNMAETILNPPQGPDVSIPNGPRLSDQSIQTSTYGAVIPRVYGTAPVMGNIFWLENDVLREQPVYVNPDGAGTDNSYYTYSYYATFALGLCQGPIVGIGKIWIGGKLQYDGLSTNVSRLAKNKKFHTRFELYTGSDTQIANDRMQVAVDGRRRVAGISNAASAVITFRNDKIIKSLIKTSNGLETTSPARIHPYIVGDVIYLDGVAGMVNGAVGINDSLHTVTAVSNTTVMISTNTSTWTAYIGGGNAGKPNCPAYRGLAYIIFKDLPLDTIGNTLATAQIKVEVVQFGSAGTTIITQKTLPSSRQWQAIEYGKKAFVALAGDATDYTSVIDGVPLAWESNFMMVGGDSGKLATSIDGITWTLRTTGMSPSIVFGVAYGSGKIVAVGGSGLISTSSDGTTWTARTSGFSTTAIYAVCFSGSLFVAVGGAGNLSTSQDGVTWTSRTSGFGTGVVGGATNILGVTHGGTKYIIVGGKNTGNTGISYSSDGITWTPATSVEFVGTLAPRCAAYGNGVYVVAGDNGKLESSSNGTAFTSRTSGFGTTVIESACFGNGIFLIGGQLGKLATSTDGITWSVTTNGTADINGLTYSNGLFVAARPAGVIETSPDGINWTARTSGFGSSEIWSAGAK